jgi:molecular chaperone HtpG
MLQHNPQLQRIRKALTKRLFTDLSKKAEGAAEEYATFWDNFGAVIKEGLYEDFEHRDQLFELARFRSTGSDGLSSLKDYIGRMKDGQDAIYYITGEDAHQVAQSPQLEGFKAKGIEVLLLTDPVDEFWVPSVGEYEGKPFKSATRGNVDLSAVKDTDAKDTEEGKKKADTPDIAPLIARFKLALGDAVKDVRVSERLTDSPVCLVADEGDLDIHLERILKQHKQLAQATPRVMEINPKHALIGKLAERALAAGGQDSILDDAAMLLLDQARIVEGESLADPLAFSRRMAKVMEKGLAAG